MPDGIIRDPKMNPRERNFGIVYLPGKDKCYKYQKGEQDYSRFYYAGEAVIAEVVEDFAEPQFEGCIKISGRVNIICYDPDESTKVPVINRLIRPLPPQARGNAINGAWSQITSDFPDPPKPPFPNPPNCPE